MPTRNRTAELARLADRLIIRHLRVSVPQSEMRSELQRDRSQELLLEQRVRCVAVVGAGASAPLLDRGEALTRQLQRRFSSYEEARERELLRLQRVYGLDPNDFETRLAALGHSPEIANAMRQEISRAYRYRHPTILGYELLAHLLKHRFLDAIVSFNFDELLDQSLDDELGVDGYRRLVSDRDCSGVVDDPDAESYLPLYVKLHGTAADPDSLRFTREAYYKLPQELVRVLGELFESQLCVIVCVGSGMTGFDLHRLLRIPQQLEIYDLSFTPLRQEVRRAIAHERIDPMDDSYHRRLGRDAPIFPQMAPHTTRLGCDDWLERLVTQIEQRSGSHAPPRRLASLVRFRSVDRHEAVADVLGSAATLSRWIEDPDRYPADYVEYLRQRTIVELAFSGAKARGLAQLSWLALDRCGVYYEQYRAEGRRLGRADSWNSLRVAAGLEENKALPDVVESNPSLCPPGSPPTLQGDDRWALREFVPDQLARHVITRIGNGDPRAKGRLAAALRNLQAGSEVEVNATDDRVCAKAFDSPLTLPTVTALSIFTAALFKDLEPADAVYISCETGEWLLEDDAVYELLSKQEKVVVLTAFEFKHVDLRRRYDARLRLRTIDPWRHNRHMTIVCRGEVPSRAVYFARRLRAPVITPVYLEASRDARRVKHAFDLMLSASSASEAVE